MIGIRYDATEIMQGVTEVLAYGTAVVVERGDSSFDTLLGRFRGALAPRMRAIVTITVTKALPLTSPAYDDGTTEPEIRRTWTSRFRKLQPNERFEE